MEVEQQPPKLKRQNAMKIEADEVQRQLSNYEFIILKINYCFLFVMKKSFGQNFGRVIQSFVVVVVEKKMEVKQQPPNAMIIEADCSAAIVDRGSILGDDNEEQAMLIDRCRKMLVERIAKDMKSKLWMFGLRACKDCTIDVDYPLKKLPDDFPFHLAGDEKHYWCAEGIEKIDEKLNSIFPTAFDSVPMYSIISAWLVKIPYEIKLKLGICAILELANYNLCVHGGLFRLFDDVKDILRLN
jgi:hypothetical protein